MTWRTTRVLLLISSFFQWRSATFVISTNTNMDCILIHNFIDSLKVVLINMIAIFMMSAKLTTVDLLKIKVFWNKRHDLVIFVHDVTSKILSRNSHYIVCVFMWAKFGNSRISIREVIIISIYKDLARKINSFEGCSRFNFSNFEVALDMDLTFYTSVIKWLKLKVIKFWWLIPTFLEFIGEKLVGGLFPPFAWIGLKSSLWYLKKVLRRSLCYL